FAFAADNSVPARSHTAVQLPSGWTGAIDLTLRFSSALAGTVKFNVDKACSVAGVAPGETPAFSNVEAITFSVTDTNAHVAGISGLSLPSCNPGDMLFLRLQRDNTTAGNAPSTARLLGAKVAIRHQ